MRYNYSAQKARNSDALDSCKPGLAAATIAVFTTTLFGNVPIGNESLTDGAACLYSNVADVSYQQISASAIFDHESH